MPEKVEECVRSVMDDNPGMDEDRAWAICKSQEQEGNLEDGADLATGCPDGQVDIGGECVPYEEVDAPASLLSAPRIMASASPLDTQPIEREELEGDLVVYHNLKLVDEGVWTDSNSETPTLYDDRTFENTTPEYPSEYDGPPVNIAHDLHKDGPNAGEPHEASIGGYIDPDSLQSDNALYGDLVLDRSTDAGAFADTNLKSALENDGTAGFSPSVELMPTELRDAANHPRAEEYVAGAELTGLGLVRDPASRSVDLAHESRNRSVALSASGGEEIKTLHRQTTGMSPETTEEIRMEILSRELQVEEIEDDAQNIADELDIPVDEVMEVLDPLLDMDDEEEEGEGEGEPPEMEDDDEEEEDEDEQGMEYGKDAVDALQDQVASLSERLEELEDMMASQSELSEAKQELADAETVEELEDVFDKRLSRLEEEPEDAKTLADDSEGDEGFDWSDADSGVEYDPATGSMSR